MYEKYLVDDIDPSRSGNDEKRLGHPRQKSREIREVLSEYCGAKHIVAVNNRTAALHVALTTSDTTGLIFLKQLRLPRSMYDSEKDYRWSEDAWIMQNLRNSTRILEVGYGAGGLLLNIAQNTANVELYGADMKKSVAVKRTASLVVSDVKHLPFRSKSFDAIICRDLLHHLQGKRNARKALEEIRRALKHGGPFIIVEVTATSRLLTELVYSATKTLALLRISDYVLMPKYTDQHNVVVSFFTLPELVESLRQLFTLEKTRVNPMRKGPIAEGLYHRVFFILSRREI
jgi:ubiquinone/menaquinone biosynthesis C-methylase UbiE